MTFNIWAYKARGLYETHKLLFTLLLTLRIDLQMGKLKPEEMQVFVKGGASRDLESEEKKPGKWIEDAVWLNLIELSQLQHFKDLTTLVGQLQNSAVNLVGCRFDHSCNLDSKERERMEKVAGERSSGRRGHSRWSGQNPGHIPQTVTHPKFCARQNYCAGLEVHWRLTGGEVR